MIQTSSASASWYLCQCAAQECLVLSDLAAGEQRGPGERSKLSFGLSQTHRTPMTAVLLLPLWQGFVVCKIIHGVVPGCLL